MAVTLVCHNEQERHEIPEAWTALLTKLLEITADNEQIKSGEVALTFVDDEQIHELNRTYRDVDRPTDVLSFPMLEEGETGINYEPDDEGVPVTLLGDIIISVDRAVEQSEQYGHSVEREIGFLFVHGFLHLLGYDHDSDEAERIMFSKQEEILQQAGLSR